MSPPRVMFFRRRVRPKRPARRQFGPELLESRHLPSVALSGVVATDPADGATPIQAPQAFTITFDQSVVDQIDAAFADLLSVPPDQVLPTLVGSDFNQDVEIDRVGAGGAATLYLSGTSNPSLVDTITTTTAADGTTQTHLVVSLPPGSPSLGQGTYQLDLLPQTLLASAFAAIEPDSAWATATNPIPIARFTVLGQGPTLTDASDLGTIGPKMQTVSGSIDPGNAPSAVALYRFTLPQGQTWQLDAQVLAQAIGSPVQAALTLFDASGNVLATRDAGASSSAGSIDPELVTGLGPGTYFLGVSAARNIPGYSFGYDPITGKPGTAGVNEPAGAFRLDLSATPVPPPVSLVAFNLDYADSLEPSPTELDLTFSGPVDVSSLTQPDRQETALTVVDASGRTWSITAVHYQASQHRLELLFDEALPAGSYSLVVPSQGGLTDLSGRPVVGPSGNAPGVLATWTVAAPSGPSDPNNLGVLWPGPANVTWAPAISRSTTLNAGQEADYRFVVIYSGWYSLLTQAGTGSVDVQSDAPIYLDPGVYDLRMIAEGSQPATVQWTLKAPPIDYEKFDYNGVGQSSALSLPLVGSVPGSSGVDWGILAENTTSAAPVGPVPGSSGVSSNPESSGNSSAGATPTAAAPAVTVSTAAASAGAATGPAAFAASPIPITLLVTLDTGLAGLPAPGSGQVAALGPQSQGATAALNDAGRGLTQGIFGLSTSGADTRVGEGNPADGPDSVPPAPLAQIGSTEPAVASDPEAASARADAMALARADGMVRLAAWLSDRIAVAPTGPGEADLPSAGFGTTLLAAVATTDGGAATGDATAGGPGRGRRRETFTQADLGAPFILLVGTALSYRLSKPIRKWWRWYHAAHAAWPRPFAFRRGAMPASSRL